MGEWGWGREGGYADAGYVLVAVDGCTPRCIVHRIMARLMGFGGSAEGTVSSERSGWRTTAGRDDVGMIRR